MTNLNLYIDVNPEVLTHATALLGDSFDASKTALLQVMGWLQNGRVLDINEHSMFYDENGLITQPWKIFQLEGVSIFMLHAINKNGELGWCEVYFEPAYKTFEQFNDEQARALLNQVMSPINLH